MTSSTQIVDGSNGVIAFGSKDFSRYADIVPSAVACTETETLTLLLYSQLAGTGQHVDMGQALHILATKTSAIALKM